jgi:hypothetical protein
MSEARKLEVRQYLNSYLLRQDGYDPHGQKLKKNRCKLHRPGIFHGKTQTCKNEDWGYRKPLIF